MDKARDRRADRPIIGMLILLTLAVYWQVWDFELVNFDDDVYIEKNPVVLAGLTSPGVRWALTANYQANWHPLKRIGYQGRGWDEGFEISGVNGRLILQTPVWNEPETSPALLRYYDNDAETWTDFAFPVVNPFIEAERHFIGQIEQGIQGPQDRYTGYRADYLLEMARRSAVEGKKLPLEWVV